jgi:phosphoribosylformylglycinamidine synthase I
MKFSVIVFPGSNCDEDTIWALKEILKHEVRIVRHDETDLGEPDVVILPGGFSFGDYLRAGAIARFSQVMGSVIDFANKGGFVMGICNGFQILCESGLLPGSLLLNENGLFSCKNIFIRAENSQTLISCAVGNDEILKMPIANKEGRYYVSESLLKQMNENGQIVFRYCSSEGRIDPASKHSGSMENIAGICNPGKNVFGMMPHPERAMDSSLGNASGIKIFDSISMFFDKIK